MEEPDKKPSPKLPIPKGAAAPRISIEIDMGSVINECSIAIKEYDLKNLVEKARREGFKHLKEPEKELLCLGLIKLGEALTFCRNREALARTGIVDAAMAYANARNHFVHHQLYHTHLHGGHYTKAQELIERLPKIEVLEEKLKNLQECGLKKLAKPIRKGENDFPFKYDHYIVCLRAEFEGLKQILSAPNALKDISSRIELRAMLENRIRNILAIMVDLTEVEINKNNGDPCGKQKDAAEEIKRSFVEEFPEFVRLILNLKEFRNSLCHLDETLKRPYINTEDMLAFAVQLRKMEELGYVLRLEKQFLSEQKIAPRQIGEKKEVLKRERESEKSESSAPEQKSSEKDETEKKTKADKPSEEQKKEEEEAPQTVSEGLQLIAGYGSSSDEEEEQQKPPDPTNTPTSTPRMGGH